ncbi:hypothetical protein [Streptomyces nigrescens]
MAERSPRDPRDPLDEEAAWAEIVAGYGEQPSFPAGDGDGGDGTAGAAGPAAAATKDGTDGKPEAAAPSDTAGKDGQDDGAGTGDAPRPGSFVVFAPGVGPRDWSAGKPSDDDFDETDEGHFTPPEPPPLPKADTTTKFAWLAVVGGPMLLVAMVLLQQPVTWWITVLGIGGFLGGFATLVARMKDDDEDDNDLPGSGAVV